MKKSISILLFVILGHLIIAQESSVKIIFVDSTSRINIELKEIMKGYLIPAGVESAEFLDYTKRCEFYFANFTSKGEDFEMSVNNCERETVGKKTIYKEIMLTNKEDMAKALASEIISILKNDSSIAAQLKGDGTELLMINHHDSRHFFAPSAFNLRKGDLYYSTYYGIVHEAQYGLTDNLSIGGGTTLGLFPVFVTPKYSINISEKARIAVGDLFIAGTYSPFAINLAYGTLTLGSHSNNVSLGGGVIHSSFSDAGFLSTSMPVFNLSTMQSFSRYVYLLSENYLVIGDERTITSPISVAGFSGLRFIFKKMDVSSLQVGLAYIYSERSYFSSDFIALPAISYTHKFGFKL